MKRGKEMQALGAYYQSESVSSEPLVLTEWQAARERPLDEMANSELQRMVNCLGWCLLNIAHMHMHNL